MLCLFYGMQLWLQIHSEATRRSSDTDTARADTDTHSKKHTHTHALIQMQSAVAVAVNKCSFKWKILFPIQS